MNRGWCSVCDTPCTLDMAMLDTTTYRVVCAKCAAVCGGTKTRPLVAATIDADVKTGMPASLSILRYNGYALTFRLPFNIECESDIAVIGHSSMPSVDGLHAMDAYGTTLSSELDNATALHADQPTFEHADNIGIAVNALLRTTEFSGDQNVRKKLRLCARHNTHLVMSGMSLTFKRETAFIKELPIGTEGTLVAVAPSEPVMPAMCLPVATARCELKVKSIAPGNTVVLSCIELGLMRRISACASGLVPSFVAVISYSGWQAGVFALEGRVPLVSVSAGHSLLEPVRAFQWPLKAFVGATETRRCQSGAPFYAAEERCRQQAARLQSPLLNPDTASVSLCIALDARSAIVLGTAQDNTLCGAAVGDTEDSCFLVFIKWDQCRWAHLLSMDSVVVIVDGDIEPNVPPCSVIVERISSRSICPASLVSAVRTGAVEWTTTGWRGPCTDLQCVCQLLSRAQRVQKT